MEYKTVIKQLESMGTAQNRKTYTRHGVKSEMFGVSYANLGKLRKSLKVNHDLARELWASGNHDARVLAAMIADPRKFTSKDLDAWAKDLDNYVLTDAFSGVVGRTPLARPKMETWTKGKGEWTGRTGWQLLATIAMNDRMLPDEYFESYLEQIVSRIHDSKNRVRDAMNNALIAIGLRNSKLEKRAVGAAKKIGKVEVDHGETSCKTPDAIEYIERAKARRRRSER
jgi:3-methyladenine DNA glycosylase AlkD